MAISTLIATVDTAKSNLAPIRVGVCQNCGVETEFDKNSQKYCLDCMVRICQECDSPFLIRQITGNPKYCSSKCYWLALSKRPAHNKGNVHSTFHVCPMCKKEFDTHYKITRIFCSPKCRTDFNSGDNHYQWKGGYSKDWRDSEKYSFWRKSVYRRDNWKCLLCLDNNEESPKELEAHHIKTASEYPDLVYVISNGITLCQFHHKDVIHKNGWADKKIPKLFEKYLTRLIQNQDGIEKEMENVNTYD